MKTVTLKNKFETSAEELKNSGVNFVAHDPNLSKEMKRWGNRHEMWNRHEKLQREKSATQN